ncbi:MAG TPA: DCC1-like thiol-disulfide oxidoreductase family protein [Bacteroidales bacterium]|nr:DCC1-like thiol-disulfide oxidoreductase family protein [Bacteroidales bacterium]
MAYSSGIKSSILYDGACNLCNTWMRFIKHISAKNTFNYLMLQSLEAEKLFDEPGLRSWGDTVILIHNDKVYTRSDAIIKIFELSKFPWRALSFLKLVPHSLRDNLYNFIAGNRYKWFGKRATCHFEKTGKPCA